MQPIMSLMLSCSKKTLERKQGAEMQTLFSTAHNLTLLSSKAESMKKMRGSFQYEFLISRAWRVVQCAYLCDHHDNEAVLDNLVVGDRLRLIVHHLTVCDKFLCCCVLPMCCFDKGFQSSDLC